jgi:hypothetical protein
MKTAPELAYVLAALTNALMALVMICTMYFIDKRRP